MMQKRFHQWICVLTTLFLLFMSFPVFSLTAPGINDLGLLPGGTVSSGIGVNYNATTNTAVVVGTADSFGSDRAFRWTEATGMVSLGLLPGGTFSRGFGINADGSVIVGEADDGVNSLAFRWTQATGMVSLGSLNGGTTSFAAAVSADGSIVVGGAADGANANAITAFRWTQATGMQGIGILPGGAFSQANDISQDGLVIVGTSGTAGNDHAFRWTQAGGMVDLGVLPGATDSSATATNSDGSVVVGSSQLASQHAYRWTQADGMVDIGVLPGGTFSLGFDVNADGSVIVGQADDIDGSKGFRWTQATGMQTVENWLRSLGANIPADITFNATGVNADGSIAVGILINNHAYIALSQAGIIDVPNFSSSLANTSELSLGMVNMGDLIMHGAHGHPLSQKLCRENENAIVLFGDWARFRQNNSKAGLIEVADFYRFGPYTQAAAGFGQTINNQQLIFDGSTTSRGNYFFAELMQSLPYCPNIITTLSGFYYWGNINVNRGYLNGGVSVFSTGKPNSQMPMARLRLDWQNLLEAKWLCLTPYGEFSYLRSRISRYEEINGGFPAVFARRRDCATELRVGFNTATPIAENLSLLTTLEGVHQFNKNTSISSGQVLGVLFFDFPGNTLPQNWLRGSLGLEQKCGPGVINVYLNASTQGLDPKYWGALSYRISF